MNQREKHQAPVTIEVESAERRPTSIAPQDYRPTLESRVMVYDDELPDLRPMMGWQCFFAGGSNRLHWVRTDREAQPHFVEGVSLEGDYEAQGPSYPATGSGSTTPMMPSGRPTSAAGR